MASSTNQTVDVPSFNALITSRRFGRLRQFYGAASLILIGCCQSYGISVEHYVKWWLLSVASLSIDYELLAFFNSC